MNVDAFKARTLVLQKQFDKLGKAFISPHFTWGEVFINCTPAEITWVFEHHPEYFDAAVKQSVTMEQVRAFAGNKPIKVHSWYRSPARNKRVGGAEHSQHLYARATDFNVEGMESDEANKHLQALLDKAPFMAQRGLEFTKGPWVHVDSRSIADGLIYQYRFDA